MWNLAIRLGIHTPGSSLAKPLVPALLVATLQPRLVLAPVRRVQEAYGVYEGFLLLRRVL